MAIVSSKSCPNCGDDHKGKPFAIYSDGYHCFSCGAHKRSDRDFLTQNKKVDDNINLPKRTNFSIENLKWLRQYHITDDLIYKYGIYECKSGSIVMPVCINDRIVKIHQRWLNPRKDFTQGDFKHKPIINRDNNVIILVEDFISFIRVGESFSCCCLFGTSLDFNIIKSLLTQYDNVVVWLDDDHEKEKNSGQIAAGKLINKINKCIYKYFSLSNKHVYNLKTKQDPKAYTNTEIHKFITNEVCHAT